MCSPTRRCFCFQGDADLIDNGRRLPFMYTAASQVGVFDDPDQQSIPEVLMNRPDGGVIGFISAARVGFHRSNMYLAREFHRLMYRSEESHLPLGMALTIAKQNITGNQKDRTNMQRYCLIGDPALRLARPRYAVALEVPDSVRALEEGRCRRPDSRLRRTAGGRLHRNRPRAGVRLHYEEQAGRYHLRPRRESDFPWPDTGYRRPFRDRLPRAQGHQLQGGQRPGQCLCVE